MSLLPPFHLAIQVRDLGEARRFYGEMLGFPEGRSAAMWVDFDCYGHQLVCHLNPNLGRRGKIENHCNPVDRHSVPVPHFGVVLGLGDWGSLAGRLRDQDADFLIPPDYRFVGEPGEQATLFIADPSGNVLEFKGFKDRSRLFQAG